MRRLVVIVAVLGLFLAACGASVGDGGPVTDQTETTSRSVPDVATTSASEPGATTATTVDQPGTTDGVQSSVQVFFIQDGTYAKPVTRTVPIEAGVAAGAIRELIEGPSQDEVENGLSGAIPPETLLLGVTIANGLATIDLSQEFEQGGGSFGMLSRLATVVYTLTQFDTVDNVRFHIDGRLVTVFSGEGILLEHPVDRSDYESVLPLTPPSPRWAQSDLPATDDVASELVRRVVLVASDDVLNVRSGAGVSNPIIGMLEPGAVVSITTEQATVSGSDWMKINVPGGTGWVNGRYLGANVDRSDFNSSDSVPALLDRLAALMASGGDLTDVVSQRGLYIVHNAPPVLFPHAELVDLLMDSTTYKWGSAALEPDSPELPSRTFVAAVGDRFVSAYDDGDTSIRFNEVELGGNGTPAEFAIPFEFQGFNFVSVYDPGDDSEFGGLDWNAWYVSIDYEDGEPVVVALTVNEWAP